MLHSGSTKFSASASSATASSLAGSVRASHSRRMRAIRPGRADAGIGSDGPRPGAKKSLALIGPIARASSASALRTPFDRPTARTTSSQAALKAQYTAPLTRTKVPATSAMRRRSRSRSSNNANYSAAAATARYKASMPVSVPRCQVMPD